MMHLGGKPLTGQEQVASQSLVGLLLSRGRDLSGRYAGPRESRWREEQGIIR